MPTRLFRSRIVTALASCVALGGVAQASNLGMYDLDFNGPEHTIGAPPAEGFGPPARSTISSLFAGTPTVVSAYGGLNDRPVVFDSFDGQGDQIWLDLTDLPSADRYTIGFDIVITHNEHRGDFNVLVDAPAVRRLTFADDGRIFASANGHTDYVDDWEPGRPTHIEITVNLSADWWAISIDGRGYISSFGGATEINAVRFSTEVFPNPPGVRAAVDNIEITGRVRCYSDLNDDGQVDLEDLLAVLAGWGACPDDGWCEADLNGDHFIDFADVVELLAEWGPCKP